MTAEVDTRSWRSAVASSKWAFDEGADNLEAVNWQWLVDLPQDAVVLDLGAGLGRIAHALAPRCREVVVAEPVRERSALVRQRLQQEGLSNVRLLNGSPVSLPFAAGSFDLVAMETTSAVSTQLIDGASRVLRRGGSLYLGVESRASLPCWPGGAVRRTTRLLDAAGFDQIRCFVVLPGLQAARFLIPFEGSPFSYYVRNFAAVPSNAARRLARAALSSLGLYKHCQSAFVFMAKKGDAHDR